jgi:hypothetical protein
MNSTMHNHTVLLLHASKKPAGYLDTRQNEHDVTNENY